jgi:tryptophan synthase alpha chain
MNRLVATFETLKSAGKKGLVGYLTAGDPDPAKSLDHVLAALENGLDVLELGVPFSDPTADGPTIQAASHRALAGGMTVGRALEMVKAIRARSPKPIVLFGYANPFFRYGFDRLCRDAAGAGADGFLVVDLPYEESGPFVAETERNDLCFIPLVAPTTPLDRVSMICRGARGFLYYIMVTGVTGARQELVKDLDANVTTLRKATSLPIAAGFGVSSGPQAAAVARVADAVVVGSSLVQAARDDRVGVFTRELRTAIDGSGD